MKLYEYILKSYKDTNIENNYTIKLRGKKWGGGGQNCKFKQVERCEREKMHDQDTVIRTVILSTV